MPVYAKMEKEIGGMMESEKGRSWRPRDWPRRWFGGLSLVVGMKKKERYNERERKRRGCIYTREMEIITSLPCI